MATRSILAIIFILFCTAIQAAAVTNDENFTVIYRFEVRQSTPGGQAGYLLINVINNGETPVKDLSVLVPDPADPALPHFPVRIGDLEPGFAKEVLELFDAPNATPGNRQEEAVRWRIEYINTAGEKQQADVMGQLGI